MLPGLIDIVIVVLLVGTLGYGVVLDRRVRKLMETLREMEPMVGAFSSAVDQSAKSVEDLRRISEDTRRPDPSLSRKAPAGKAAQPAPVASPAERLAAAREKAPVRGQASVPGKSDLVRTFFDITKERKE